MYKLPFKTIGISLKKSQSNFNQNLITEKNTNILNIRSRTTANTGPSEACTGCGFRQSHV